MIIKIVNPWDKDTCLIIGDSTILGLEEHRMGGKFKVRGHSGAIIADLYHHIIPMGPKNPRYIIIMIGTNDAINKTAGEMISEIKDLKVFIEEILSDCDVIISCATKRTDHRKAASVVFDFRKKLINLNFPLILNSNITEDHLVVSGRHLNRKGASNITEDHLVVSGLHLNRKGVGIHFP